MFAWKEKRDFLSQIEKLTTSSVNANGTNRRAIGLFPLPASKQRHDQSSFNSLNHHQLLISIEGRQNTCCIKIISPKELCRSAILVFRGRVLGCLYGKKGSPTQAFGELGHSQAIATLAHPHKIIDVYMLDEGIAVAAASLFHGNVLRLPESNSAEESFEWLTEKLMQSGMPGCIVISRSDQSIVCMVYFFAGKIIGIYSFKDGWTETSYESGLRYLQHYSGSQVMASLLPVHNLEEVKQLTFSLTGLADRFDENRDAACQSPEFWISDALSEPSNSESAWLKSASFTGDTLQDKLAYTLVQSQMSASHFSSR